MTRAITTKEEAVAALQEIAAGFGVSFEVLLDPIAVRRYMRRSALLRNVLEFFGEEPNGRPVSTREADDTAVTQMIWEGCPNAD